jgi:hypothetical protein
MHQLASCRFVLVGSPVLFAPSAGATSPAPTDIMRYIKISNM